MGVLKLRNINNLQKSREQSAVIGVNINCDDSDNNKNDNVNNIDYSFMKYKDITKFMTII